MTILGIETSCDETAAAVVENGTKILSNVVASSQSLHAKFGGIIPDKAAREQLKSILPVIEEALLQFSVYSLQFTVHSNLSTVNREPNSTVNQIDALAVTIGPGLIGSLLVGVETAKALALAWHKPLIPVNHLIGHIYANWLSSSLFTVDQSSHKLNTSTVNPFYREPVLPAFPALVLIVSGGHSELILMKDHGKFTYLGGTRDDAAGECFDKCARLLGLGYPGGPAIEAAALLAPSPSPLAPLPRPLLHDKSFDFSFSGLKTAAATTFRSTVNREPNSTVNHLAYELQEAVSDVLVKKTLQAAEKYQVKSILLAGGVAANKNLREKLILTANRSLLTARIHIPPISLCTDNAAYIASAAYFNQKTIPWRKIDAVPDLNIPEEL